MSAFGETDLIKIPGAIYQVAQDGFATYDKSYSGIPTGGVVFHQGDAAAEWPSTVLLSVRVTETGDGCDHVRIDLHYEGKDTDFSGSDPDFLQNISIDFTTSAEPIESHIDFVSSIGGTPIARLHGANFDRTTGEFLSFPVVDPDEPDVTPSRFAGLRSYLMPKETFTSNTVELDYPDADYIASVGRVFDPGLPLPTLPGDRNWLNTGIRVQNIGNVYYRTQKTGMLSGPRPFISEVYGDGG